MCSSASRVTCPYLIIWFVPSEVIEHRKNALLQEQLAEFLRAEQTLFADSLLAVKERGKRSASTLSRLLLLRVILVVERWKRTSKPIAILCAAFPLNSNSSSVLRALFWSWVLEVQLAAVICARDFRVLCACACCLDLWCCCDGKPSHVSQCDTFEICPFRDQKRTDSELAPTILVSNSSNPEFKTQSNANCTQLLNDIA